MNGTISLQSKLKGAVSMANTIINGGASPYPKHVGPAAICSFSDGAQEAPLKSLKFYIEPSQSGSGDPSPSNIRPISGWSQVDGKQSGEDMTDYTPITIALGQTVYGGAVDALAGEGESQLAAVVIDGNSTVGGSATSGFYVAAHDMLRKIGYTTADIICDRLPTIESNWSLSGNNCGISGYSNSSMYLGQNWIYFATGDPNITTTAQVKTWLTSNPLTVVYRLTSPTTFSTTPVSVNSLLGQNNIWCNTGDTELDYYPAAASIVAVQNRSTKMYVSIPLGMIRYETYQITPQQTIDLDSYRSENGNLLRNPVATKCKLEFNTPLMTDTQWGEIWNIIKAGFNNNTERKLKLKYYDTLSATYKTGYFYVPDVQTTIRNIEEGPGVINYQEIRLAFIEY